MTPDPDDLRADAAEAEQLLVALRNITHTPGAEDRADYLLHLAAAVMGEVARGERPLLDDAPCAATS